MRETTIQILSKRKVKELQPLAIALASRLESNWDFKIAEEMEREDLTMFKAWGEAAGHGGSFHSEYILPKEDFELYQKMLKFLNRSFPKMKKADLVEILAEYLNHDAFSEYVFYTMDKKELELIPEELGIKDKLQPLLQDKVFLSRLYYMWRVKEYYQAATNLYGVIDLTDLADLIFRMEMEFSNSVYNKYGDYTRTTGWYRESMMMNPANVSPMGMAELLNITVRQCPITLDGLVLHEEFFDEWAAEMEAVREDVDLLKAAGDEAFYEIIEEHYGKATYRKLAAASFDKPMYIPDREEFMKYIDEDYMEMTPQAEKLTAYLKANFKKGIEKAAKEETQEEDELLRDVVHMVRIIMNDNTSDRCLGGDNEYIQEVFRELEDIDVHMDKMNDVNELLTHLVEVKNTDRCWFNHGYSPIEISQIKYMQPAEKPTIVPGSSAVAEILSENKEELEEMGVTIDLNSNAAQMPVFGMPQGVNGQINQKAKKIYPNDPCPCGSGKKYKKCCGK